MTLRQRVGERWNNFWFKPQQTSTLAVFRLVFGVLVSLWTLSQLPNLFAFYGPQGIYPSPRPLSGGQWGVLNVVNSVAGVSVVWLGTLLAALALAVGWRPRIAAVVVFVGVSAFLRRNTLVLNTGDDLIRFMAFYLMFAPSGVALSFDRWRKNRESFWDFPKRAPWALRLLQIQLCVIYLSTVWAKVQGDTWRSGTAVAFAMRVGDIVRFPLPEALADSPPLVEALTFGTLALELAIPILVWNRAARPWVLGLGVLMHLGIDISIMVGFFSAAMWCLYLVFLPPETASRLVLGARDRLLAYRPQRYPNKTPSSPIGDATDRTPPSTVLGVTDP